MSALADEFLLRIADTNLVTAQRLGEIIGHAPEIEQDISLANLGLDHLERARTVYQHLAQLKGAAYSEDYFAYQRQASEFRNLSLAEQPNSDYAHLILRQYLLDAWHLMLFPRLSDSSLPVLAQHWRAWYQEARYHHRYSAAWTQRLGDGTEESNTRMHAALSVLWPFRLELIEADELELRMESMGLARIDGLGQEWLQEACAHLSTCGLEPPDDTCETMAPIGKRGEHTRFLDGILDELQYMQRTYPNLSW